MYTRHLEPYLKAALADTPVVLLLGARQTGKTTLVRPLAHVQEGEGAVHRYFTLDDLTPLAAAQADPEGFLAAIEGPVILDEVQRAPQLFQAIKALVDRERTPGRFLLTGSADPMLLPEVSESLAGRVETLTLWPLAQSEIEHAPGRFVDVLFGDRLPELPPEHPDAPTVWERIARGGFPEAVSRTHPDRRERWFASYLTTLLQRDIRDLAGVEASGALLRLVQMIAFRSGSLVNYSELSRAVGIPLSTLRRYVGLLEATFLYREVPAWTINLSKRLTKAPKGFITDTGLLASLWGSDPQTAQGPMKGALLETFVALEVMKATTWSAKAPVLHHFRTATGQEVDLVLERRDGLRVGIEVKAARSCSRSDFSGLLAFRDTAPERFHRGIVLYDGEHVIPFGDQLWAVPLRALWRW